MQELGTPSEENKHWIAILDIDFFKKNKRHIRTPLWRRSPSEPSWDFEIIFKLQYILRSLRWRRICYCY
jgi:hypothetical protein